MKSKILTIVMIMGGYFLAAQVPNTTTFSLQDVVDVVNPTTDDLADCFSDAIVSKFDPAYAYPVYPANSLLIFRNYGNVGTPPNVIDLSTTDIMANSVTLNGQVVSDGGAAVFDRGFYYGTSLPATNKLSAGSGVGAFDYSLSGLLAGTTYYYFVYAENSQGLSMTGDASFVTLSGLPTVTTNAVASITAHSASFSGTLNSGTGITNYGFYVYASDQTTLLNTVNNPSSFTGSWDLIPCYNTNYYVQAFATNSSGTGVGSKVSFNTSSVSPNVLGYALYTVNGASITSEATAISAVNDIFANGVNTSTTSFVFKRTTAISSGSFFYPTSNTCFSSMNNWFVWYTGSTISNGQKLNPVYVVEFNTATNKVISATMYSF